MPENDPRDVDILINEGDARHLGPSSTYIRTQYSTDPVFCRPGRRLRAERILVRIDPRSELCIRASVPNEAGVRTQGLFGKRAFNEKRIECNSSW